MKGTVRRFSGGPSFQAPLLNISVPTTESIHFHHLMDMPLPFATDAAARLPYCHLPIMISKSFLEDGEWAGFYCTSFGSQSPHFDSPMRNIHFQVDDFGSTRHTLIIQANGVDSVGEFTLLGRMATDIGNMQFSKTYTGGTPQW
ncbi:MAG: hypothetical protein Q9218_007999, partial [Villophora microphyllina]